MKKAVVTGANGFVGRAVVHELSIQEYYIYAVVRENDRYISQLSEIENVVVVPCDMENYRYLEDKIFDTNIQVFYHLAWEGSSGELRNNERVQLSNVQYSCDAVRVASHMGIKRFVFASSIMEYEVIKLMRLQVAPVESTIYSTSKITANYMCRALAGVCGIEYVSAMISNIFGPGENSPRLINTTIKKLLKGEHVSFSTGEQLYDFIYITDAAKIFVLLADKGKSNRTYYVGNKTPRKLKEFLLELRDVVSPNTQLGLGEIPFGRIGLEYNELDIASVYADFLFEPQIPFVDGISRTAEWIIKKEKGHL